MTGSPANLDGTADSWDALLRQHGYRITPQRQLVLAAVNELQHGTPEEMFTSTDPIVRQFIDGVADLKADLV